jgi:hypothetical protein
MTESFVIQIFRRDGLDPDRLTGTVERIGSGGSQAFHSMQELWAVLSSPPPAARRGTSGNHD